MSEEKRVETTYIYTRTRRDVVAIKHDSSYQRQICIAVGDDDTMTEAVMEEYEVEKLVDILQKVLNEFKGLEMGVA